MNAESTGCPVMVRQFTTAALLATDPDAAPAALRRADRLLAGSADDTADERLTAAIRLRAGVVRHAAADTLQLHARYLAGWDPASAAVLLGAADRLRRKEIVPSVRAARDQATATAAGALGSYRLEAGIATGRALDDAAVAAFVADLADRAERR